MVIFKNTNLRSSVFKYAQLSYSDFSGADLTFANFEETNLNYSDFSGANLAYANFEDAKLYCADLSNVSFEFTNLINADMRKAKYKIEDLNRHNNKIDGLIISEDKNSITQMRVLAKKGAVIYNEESEDVTDEYLKEYPIYDEDDIF